MEITNKDVKVLGRVVAITTDNVVASAELVYDEQFNNGMFLNAINKHFKASDDDLNTKVDKLLTYVDETFVPLSGAVMKDEADLVFKTEDNITTIDGDGVRTHSKENLEDTVLTQNDLRFNDIQCGIKYSIDYNTLVLYNGNNQLELDFDEPVFGNNDIEITCNKIYVKNGSTGELLEANGQKATKITEEQILNLFK